MASQPAAVDAVAADDDQLMSILDGRIVMVAGGQQVQLKTLGQVAMPVQVSLSDKIWMALAVRTNGMDRMGTGHGLVSSR